MIVCTQIQGRWQTNGDFVRAERCRALLSKSRGSAELQAAYVTDPKAAKYQGREFDNLIVGLRSGRLSSSAIVEKEADP